MAGREDKGAGAALPPDARVRIGAQLRRMYDNVVQEPIPDRFTALLDQLEAKTPIGNGPAADQGGGSSLSEDGAASPPR